MLFSAAIDDWTSHRARLVDLGLVRDTTWANQKQIAETIKAHLGHHSIEGLRKSHLELFVGARLQTCKPVTVQGEMNVLRQIINWLVDEQLLVTKPRFPTVKVAAAEAPLPSDEAFRWHLRWLPAHHAAALEFMMLMGFAPHELERLEKRDERPDGIAIGGRPDFPVKQESRRRTVPMGQRAAAIWREATIGTLPLHRPFPTQAGLQKAMRRLVRDGQTTLGMDMPADADQVTPKMMRKWFASKVASEHPEQVLQRLLGHAPGSPITRKHYVRSSAEQLVGAVEALRA